MQAALDNSLDIYGGIDDRFLWAAGEKYDEQFQEDLDKALRESSSSSEGRTPNDFFLGWNPDPAAAGQPFERDSSNDPIIWDMDDDREDTGGYDDQPLDPYDNRDPIDPYAGDAGSNDLPGANTGHEQLGKELVSENEDDSDYEDNDG
ncbi:MAG: hypothetical protein ACXWC0_27065 [Burkholderiales bacterium]